jgi:hypothetical protein
MHCYSSFGTTPALLLASRALHKRTPTDQYSPLNMHELWSTILAPVLDALCPKLTLDVGQDDARVATLCAQYVAPWEGRVHSLQPVARTVSERNLTIEALGEISTSAFPADVDLALLHGDPNWWSVWQTLQALATVALEAGRPLPVVLVHNVGPPWGRRDHYSDLSTVPANALHPHRACSDGWLALLEGTPRNGVLTAVEAFVADRAGLEVVLMPGLGGTAVLAEPGNGDARLRELLCELRPSSLVAGQIELVDTQRRVEQSRADRAESRTAALETETLDHQTLMAERDQLRRAVIGLDAVGEESLVRPFAAVAGNGGWTGPGNGAAVDRSPELAHGGVDDRGAADRSAPTGALASVSEPDQALVRSLLGPRELLAELKWPGADRELALAIPHDAHKLIELRAEREIAVVARLDPQGLIRTLCSVVERADEPVAMSLLLDDAATREVNEMVARVIYAIPAIQVVHGRDAPPGAQVLIEGEELPWDSSSDTPVDVVPAVAYILPGLPPEGSGGSHSLVQEARGLRELGCDARICVPSDALPVTVSLYGNADELFVAYEQDADIVESVGPAVVAVATEHPSLALLERLVAARPEIVCAYYVQDYEPLFGQPGSVRSDRALLSYRAIPGQVLFAKTHWLRNVVVALHGTFVAKVSPSLDHELFHTDGRREGDGAVRIAAMVRPRTPRRRPSATLQVLAAIEARLGSGVQTITFGSDAEAYAEVVAGIDVGAEHLGLLSRAEVGELMRRCDIFIDASAYQAFGRSGLEAMACGAVPVLPALGGVHEYANHDHNALIFTDDQPRAIAEQVVALACDPVRLRRLREAGLRSVRDFSIERAARSQLELFSAAVIRSLASTGVSA